MEIILLHHKSTQKSIGNNISMDGIVLLFISYTIYNKNVVLGMCKRCVSMLSYYISSHES